MMGTGEAMRDEGVVVGLLKVVYKGIKRNIVRGRIVMGQCYDAWLAEEGTVVGDAKERRMRAEMSSWVKRSRKEENDKKEGKIKWLVGRHKRKPTIKSARAADQERLSGIRYTDRDMQEAGVMVDEEDGNGIEKLVAGDVKLDSDEKAVLGLPPKYCLYEKLS